MIARQRSLLAGLFGLWMMHAQAAQAQEIPTVPAPPQPVGQREPARLEFEPGRSLAGTAAAHNQQMADRIAAALTSNGRLHRYRVEVTYQNGAAYLSGHVNGEAQHEEVLRSVHGIPGVDRIVDQLEPGNVVVLRPAQDQSAPLPLVAAAPAPPSAVPAPPPFVAPPPAAAPFPPAPGAPGLAPTPLAQPLNGPPPPEPMPIFQAPLGPSTSMPPPRMPPNAWPTYAPYNNYSRVAYPTLYPYQSWPFIGPNYPFPKIPPGWRSISLEWMDGCWWYGKNACSHDWWRIRYW